MNTPVETLAVMLQRAKTHMETTGLSAEFDRTYRDLSVVLFQLEIDADVDAAALRDDDESATTGTKHWYIETEDGERRGPYTDYNDCCADADRIHGRIIVETVADNVVAWECPECGDSTEADTLAMGDAPYCDGCDCEMKRTDG